MNTELSEYSREVLENNGWHAERKVNIEKWTNWLKDRKFQTTPLVREFLVLYGGLKFEPPVNPIGIFGPSEIIFDPMYADVERIWWWEESLGIAFCPLALTHSGDASLVVSPNGNFFHISFMGMYRYGKNTRELFESIIDTVRESPKVISASASEQEFDKLKIEFEEKWDLPT